MRRLPVVVVAGILVGLVLGCGGDAAKGVNRDKDKPRPAEKEPAKH